MSYKPGDTVPASGIYSVIHDGAHHQRHEVTCIEGRRFPPCNTCGKGVEFKLRVEAVHVQEHRSFN